MNPIKLNDLVEIVRKHYDEDIWQAVKVGIAIIASLSLKGRDNCIVLVYEGPSGAGKSIIIRLLMPDRTITFQFLLRVDDFTPASFVSQAANRTSKELDKIDLLPRIKDKVMLTKELAPVFRDDEKELRKNFARLTSILDGNGYTTESGTHGSRGYTGAYLFNWLGATTPVPDRTFRVMAQLGNRILFYEIASEEWSENDLMDFAENYRTTDTISECQKAVNDFFERHFTDYPVDSIDAKSIVIPSGIMLELVRYGKLIAHGRVGVEASNRGDLASEPEVGEPEGPQRIILLLQSIIRGLALSDNRLTVSADDLAPIRHIAFSSMPRKRRELLRALLVAGGAISNTDAGHALGISSSTATNRMQELTATKIVVVTPGDQKKSRPAQIELAPNWRWLLDDTPLKQNGVVWSGDTNTPL